MNALADGYDLGYDVTSPLSYRDLRGLVPRWLMTPKARGLVRTSRAENSIGTADHMAIFSIPHRSSRLANSSLRGIAIAFGSDRYKSRATSTAAVPLTIT